MHDTAYSIGCLSMDIYASSPSAKILEIGSLNVNGSLRDHRDSPSYVGVDMEAGPGVDIVVKPGEPLPFDDDAFDLIIASSVFEHDPAFWNTFVEMCRKVRRGGHIYINAPSNGTFHRYPEDHWRFYPDCGLALVRWARQAGLDITLVESFVADRQAEVYNDFVAVFRKGPSKEPLSRTYIYQQVICYNVRTWESDELIHRRDESEDTTIIMRSRAEIAQLQQQLGQRDAQIAGLHDQLAAAQAKEQSVQVDRCVIEQLLRAAELKVHAAEAEAKRDAETRAQSENQLQLAHREIAALERKLDRTEDAAARHKQQLEQEVKALKRSQTALTNQLAKEERHNAELKAELADFSRAKQDLEAERGNLVRTLETERSDHLRALETARLELAEHQRESARIHAALTEFSASRDALELALKDTREELKSSIQRLNSAQEAVQALEADLINAENSRRKVCQEADELNRKASWLSSLSQTLVLAQPQWGMMPSSWARKHRDKSLKAENIFDVQGYLAHYPDVAGSGIDPVLHYIRYGINENRSPF